MNKSEKEFKKILSYPTIDSLEKAFDRGLITFHEFMVKAAEELGSIRYAKALIENICGNDLPDTNLFGEITLAEEKLVSPINSKTYDVAICCCLSDGSYTIYVNGDSVRVEYFETTEALANRIALVCDSNGKLYPHICNSEMTREAWKERAEQELNKEAMAALDEHEAEFGADGSRWQASQCIAVY